MSEKRYIGYYRVSTQDQGKSGLGLEAQRRSVRDFIKRDGILVGEFEDIESGASNEREGIKKAIQACKLLGATLVVKEMSRISRGGFRIMVDLEEAGINFIESTAPNDNSMMKELKFILAKDEREKISERTKNALAEIKDRIGSKGEHLSKSGNKIKALGNKENFSDKGRRKGSEAVKHKSYNNPKNKKAGGLIIALREAGKSFNAISKRLNELGFKTVTGKDYTAVQVSRLYKRYKK